jgi:hypothetical protein
MKMMRLGWMAAGVLAATTMGAHAQAPAGAPAGANGICKDGTYSMSSSKSGACRGHKGVQTWYAAAPVNSTTKTAAMPAPTPAAAVPSKPAPTPAMSLPAKPAPTAAATSPAAPSATAAKKQGPAAAAAAKTAAPGGGPGLVWVNTESNVYHCYGDTFYGKTKAGAYMSEADAKGKGAHGAHGAVCSK